MLFEEAKKFYISCKDLLSEQNTVGLIITLGGNTFSVGKETNNKITIETDDKDAVTNIDKVNNIIYRFIFMNGMNCLRFYIEGNIAEKTEYNAFIAYSADKSTAYIKGREKGKQYDSDDSFQYDRLLKIWF
jgi:hypothetical protein